MAYDGIIAELPAGRKGMHNHPNRLLAQPDELFLASGLTFEDDQNRKEAGATLFGQLTGAVMTSDTFSLSTPSAALAAVSLKGSAPAFVFGTTASHGFNAGGGPTYTGGIGSVAAGNVIVLTVSLYYSGLQPSVSVTDTKGNTYTLVAQATASSAAAVFLFVALNVTALTFSDQFTVTLSGGTTPRGGLAVIAGEYSGILAAGAVDRTAGVVKTASGTLDVSLSIPPLTSLPEIIVAGGAWLCPGGNVGPPLVTAGNAFTIGGQGIQSGGSASDVAVWQQYRVDNAPVGTPTIIALHDWWPTSTVQRLVSATLQGKLYKEVGGVLDSVTLATGLSQTARPGRFVQAGREAAALPRKLFYFNGVDAVQVLSGDGASATALGTPPADWSGTNQPVNGITHISRLVGFGNLNDPHRLYFSDPNDHTVFTGANAFTLRMPSSIGDRLFCAAQFKGRLFGWKWPRGLFYLDDTDADVTKWVMRTTSEELGCCASPYAVLPLDDDVLFLTADGTFHLLTAVTSLGGTRSSDVSYALGISKWLRDNLNLARLNQALSVWYPQKKVALFTVPSVTSQTNDLTLKFDMGVTDRGGPIRFSYSLRDPADALALRRDTSFIGRPTLGEAGMVYTLDTETRTKNGVNYVGSYQTPYLDMSHLDPRLRGRRKLWEFLELIFEPVAAGTVTAQVYVDGALRQTLTYDATSRRQRKRLSVGDGYEISVAVSNGDTNYAPSPAQDFRVLSQLVWFRLGNEDQSR